VTRVRTIWIDAICINQQDISERTQQVQFMRCIYENAEQVLIWLGEGVASSGIAMHVLEELGECEENDDVPT
jgi:hypothetical protein